MPHSLHKLHFNYKYKIYDSGGPSLVEVSKVYSTAG